MKKLLTFTLVLCFMISFGQINYIGFIKNIPIEFSANIDRERVSAIYVYTAFDEPIILTGSFENGTINLFEKDAKGTKTATLTFLNFNSDSTTIEGTWKDLKTNKDLKITLTKEIDNLGEVIQAISTKDKYFKVVTDFSNVSEIKIYQKKTDKLIQKFDVACNFRGFNNIDVGDFNFDGFADFSVFETSYAGPNTSTLYFLYNPKTKKYYDSGFSGVSLEFDSKLQRIFETNQCCAGASVTTAEYKLVNNAMVLVKERCFKLDEKTQERTERKMSDCK